MTLKSHIQLSFMKTLFLKTSSFWKLSLKLWLWESVFWKLFAKKSKFWNSENFMLKNLKIWNSKTENFSQNCKLYLQTENCIWKLGSVSKNWKLYLRWIIRIHDLYAWFVNHILICYAFRKYFFWETAFWKFFLELNLKTF